MRISSFQLFLALMPFYFHPLNAQDFPWETPASPCIAPQQDSLIWEQVRANEAHFRIRSQKRQTIRFIWPLKFAKDTTLPGYYAIYQFVDNDPVFGQVLDYNCGHRSYDLENYNHAGTDLGLYPWAWRKLDEGTVAVIAAAEGTITGKDDGYYDRNCSWGNNPPANFVIITHADGSRALYWHLKQGSVTSKPIGSTVSAGEYLGLVASSGFSNIPHLHFEIRSAEGTVIDPWSGRCNGSTATSWWVDQPPYWDPAINEIDIHFAPPSPYGSCPTPEEHRISREYNPGSIIYPAAYYRDQRKGDETKFALYRPDESLFASWSHTSPSDYLTSWWYWEYSLPNDAPLGTWTYRVQYYDQDISWTFDVTKACLEPNALAVEKPGISQAQLSWSSNADQYRLELFSGESLIRDTILSGSTWNVTGLNPDTWYSWQVTAICGEEDSSAPVAGTEFHTLPIIYFQGQDIVIEPHQPTPEDSIALSVYGLILENGATLEFLSFSITKAEIAIQADWTSTGGNAVQEPYSFSVTLPPLSEGEYSVTLKGNHGDYGFLPGGRYTFYVNGCKEIPLYISPLSDQTVWWDINQEFGLDQYIIRYRPIDSKDYVYDTLTYPRCLYPPCPGVGTRHLEYRLGEWLIRDLLPCQEYEFQLYQPCFNGEGDFSKPMRIQMACEALPCNNVFAATLDTIESFGYTMHWQDTAARQNADAYVVNLLDGDSIIWRDVLYPTPNNRHYRDHHVNGNFWVDCYCTDGFCLKPPLILPAPTHYHLTGLLPCTSYQVTVSKWCLDTLLETLDTLAVTTVCNDDPYFFPATAIQVYEPQAAGLDSICIKDQAFIFPCRDCEGCDGNGYQLLPDSVIIQNDFTLEWFAWISGNKHYVNDPTNQYIPFTRSSIALYADLNDDGQFDQQLYYASGPDLKGTFTIPLASVLDPGDYRLRLVWSPLEEPSAQGYLHFGSVIDLPVRLMISTGRNDWSGWSTIRVLNPVEDYLQLFNVPDQRIRISVVNLLGQPVYTSALTRHDPNLSLDVTHLAPGIYFITLAGLQSQRTLTFVKMK